MKTSSWLFLTVALATIAGVAAYGAPIQCPNAALGETAQDCPWASVARELEQAASHGRPVRGELERKLPALARAMKADSKNINYKHLWGETVNFDELAKAQIVRPEILKSIGELTAIPLQDKKDPAGHEVVHAGLEHTYGYLFSTLKTPYGYKRARWVQGEIEKGFGLPAGILGPNAKEGTLFQNVTFFAGSFAFRNDPKEMAELREGAKALPRALRNFPYFSGPKVVRLEEKVEVPEKTEGVTRQVTLRTDLIRFTGSGTKNSWLLVYSVMDPSRTGAQLVTAFPVADDFAKSLADPAELGDKKPVQTRYNAYVAGVTGQKLTGSRAFTEGHIK